MMIRIFNLTIVWLLFVAFPVFSQNTSEAEYNLMTITDDFPGKNYEKMIDWSWRDESQRNFLFAYAPIIRLADNSFAGTYIEIYSKVKLTKKVLFLPAQNQHTSLYSNDLLSINRSLSKGNNETFTSFNEALDKLDRKTLQAFNLSLAAYLSRYATSVQLHKQKNLKSKLQRGW